MLFPPKLLRLQQVGVHVKLHDVSLVRSNNVVTARSCRGLKVQCYLQTRPTAPEMKMCAGVACRLLSRPFSAHVCAVVLRPAHMINSASFGNGVLYPW